MLLGYPYVILQLIVDFRSAARILTTSEAAFPTMVIGIGIGIGLITVSILSIIIIVVI